MNTSRRSFIVGSGVVAAAYPAAAVSKHMLVGTKGLSDVLRAPDVVTARTNSGTLAPLVRNGESWTTSGLTLRAALKGEPSKARLPVVIESSRDDVTYLKLRWRWQIGSDPQLLSDSWERGYGDMRWQGLAPERVLPWYFYLAHAG
ncbi:MAG: hypothetical protein EOO77_09170, partial [Oxalobacteraceae bacterium]